MADPADSAAAAHRLYWGRVLSATMRLARDVDIAEEATADAFVLALQVWPAHGVPESVEAWLLTAARRRAVDRIRRLVRFRERSPLLAAPAFAVDDEVPPVVADDELRLVVLCCHPALDHEAQVALTLRLGFGVPTAAPVRVPDPTSSSLASPKSVSMGTTARPFWSGPSGRGRSRTLAGLTSRCSSPRS